MTRTCKQCRREKAGADEPLDDYPFTLVVKITFQGKVRVYETENIRIHCNKGKHN